MGILDDAIRQHLELKRRQGAADDELARLEDEAFGPPTRPGEPDFPSPEPPVDAPPPEPSPSAEPGGVPVAVGSEPPAAPPDPPPATSEGERSPDDEEHTSLLGEAGSGEVELEELDLELEDDFPQVDDLDAGGPAVPAPDTVEHPAPVEPLDTVEHAVEESPPEAEPGEAGAATETGEGEALEGEDVLEETPEFLRDQPEDDELWFEQGEPKDFDF